MNTPFVEELFVTVQFHPMIAEQKDAGILVEFFLFQVPDNLPDLPVGLEEAVIVLAQSSFEPMEYPGNKGALTTSSRL